MKIDYSKFLNYLEDAGLADFADYVTPKIDSYFDELKNADFNRWLDAVNTLPDIAPAKAILNADTVSVQTDHVLPADVLEDIRSNLMQLHPWRKGPFDIFGIKIDTEWRSDFKWQRLADKIDSLDGRAVLDVGCGSGYHCLRMLGDGAKVVVGIDPFLLFCTQFQAINRYVQTDKTSVLPLGIDDVPTDAECFDTVFSMGVLYHRKDPAEHIDRLRGLLKKGGQIVLETLVIDGADNDLLVPGGRYAKMRNVWNIPSCGLLADWLENAGFKDVQVIDVTVTTTKEQRSTDWMTFESLQDFLDKDNLKLTVEGYPGPKRAIALCRK